MALFFGFLDPRLVVFAVSQGATGVFSCNSEEEGLMTEIYAAQQLFALRSVDLSTPHIGCFCSLLSSPSLLSVSLPPPPLSTQ